MILQETSLSYSVPTGLGTLSFLSRLINLVLFLFLQSRETTSHYRELPFRSATSSKHRYFKVGDYNG